MIGKSALRWIISVVAVIAILVIILLTPAGLRITLHFASAILPGNIQYGHVSGTLTSPIEITDFKYTHQNNTLTIHKLKFSWHPWQLLHRKIDVSDFTANNVHLTLQPRRHKKTKAVSKKSEPTQKKKPYLLNIRNAHINYLSIGNQPNKYPIFIRHIRLNATIVPNVVAIRAHADLAKPFPLSIAFNVHGNIDRYTIYTRAISKKLVWHLYGLGNADGIFLNLNEGKTLGGKLSFNASFNWAPQLNWTLNLNADHLNFNELDPTWPNSVSAKINTEGKIVNKKPIFKLKTLINAPGTHIDLLTTQKDKINLKWKLNISNLSQLYKTFKGSIQSQGQWSPDAKLPVIKGTLNANNLQLLGYSANHINGNWTLYPHEQRISHFKLLANNFQNKTIQINQLSLQGRGKKQSHQISGNLNYQGNRFIFQMNGGFFNNEWRGKLKKFTLQSKTYHHWILKKPANLTLSKQRATANNLCLTSTGIKGLLCINGNWNTQGPWQFNATGKHFDPHFLTQFATPKLTLKTPATLRATITGNQHRLKSASVNLLLQKGSFRYQLNGTAIASPIQSGNINFLYTQNTLNASSHLFLSKANQLAFTISIPHFAPNVPRIQQRLIGKLNASFNDLTPFNKVLQAIAHPKGKLRLSLSLSGHLTAPDVQGQINLIDGSVFIPRLGIELTKIDSNISSYSQTRMKYNITAYSKNQPIHIIGEATQTPKGIQSTTHITANNALIMNTPQYTIYASPKLKVDMNGTNLNLTGSIDIPSGIIQPGGFTNVTTIPSDQIIYTNGQPLLNKTTWNISADLNASLGDNVSVKTSGFNVTVKGKAHIIGKPQSTTIGNGRVDVTQGTYSAYGRTLNITPGSYIEFINSPMNNPILNVRATHLIQVNTAGRTTQTNLGVNNITVGIAVRGTFRHPKISFFSIPSNLSQADILSYLVLGYASETTSGSNLGILLEAANTLGGKGTGIGGAISEIKQGLGLSELGVESETLINAIGTPVDQQSAFVIGKRLTKSIYIRYSLGLGQGPFAPVNIFQLRYTFNRHWALQTDSSSLGNGGDILYTIETN